MALRVLVIFTLFNSIFVTHGITLDQNITVILNNTDNFTSVPIPQSNVAGVQTPQSKLYDQLISNNYGPSSPRPVLNQSTQIHVSVFARPVSLIEFKEREQHINLRFYLNLEWVDKKLTWNPDENEGVTGLVVDTSDIWIPDTVLLESIGDTFIEPNNLFARVNYKGSVTWDNIVGTLTYCKLLIRYFPFDVQYCNITFTSWNYDYSQINFFYTSDMTISEQIDGFVLNGMWKLAGIEMEYNKYTFGCSPEDCRPWPSIRYILKFKRTQSSFYAANILLPCFLMSLMNLLVFLFPLESGEKMSFVMTNVLTLVLFQQLVSTMLPPSGEDSPIFSLHLFWMIIFGSISIVWTVILIIIYFKRTPYPGWLYSFLTSFRYVYYQLEFGKDEATARRRERYIKSQSNVYKMKADGINYNDLHGEEDLGEDAEVHPLKSSIERWTDDGIKIYVASADTVPVDDDEIQEDDNGISDRLRMLFCGHCGQMNATKFKIKKDKLSYNPKDARLWQETAAFFDKFMAYLMVFMTIVVYCILFIRFATHDPVSYRAANRN